MLFRGCIQWELVAGTTCGLLRRWMRKHHWQETGPWEWPHQFFAREQCTHARSQVNLRNAIRHAWRRARFVEWLHGNATRHRHEAQELLAAYCESSLLKAFHAVDFEKIRGFLSLGPAHRSVLLGAVASDMWLLKCGARALGLCSLCSGASGTFAHLMWHCPHTAASRPAFPVVPLRLAWAGLVGRELCAIWLRLCRFSGRTDTGSLRSDWPGCRTRQLLLSRGVSAPLTKCHRVKDWLCLPSWRLDSVPPLVLRYASGPLTSGKD